MKKNSKKGFSLAEVLISVGIVSVIATLGFSVARTNLDRAYNMYMYTGAKYLSDALIDADTRGNINNNLNSLANHLATLFNSTTPPTPHPQGAGLVVTARNNIRYTIIKWEVQNVTQESDVYLIFMETPTRKNVNNQELEDQPHFFHVTNHPEYPTLMPQNGWEDRIDLWKYYIRIPGDPDFPNARIYLSFRDAFCSSIGADIEVDRTIVPGYACNNAGNVNGNGIITMVRP